MCFIQGKKKCYLLEHTKKIYEVGNNSYFEFWRTAQ